MASNSGNWSLLNGLKPRHSAHRPGFERNRLLQQLSKNKPERIVELHSARDGHHRLRRALLEGLRGDAIQRLICLYTAG